MSRAYRGTVGPAEAFQNNIGIGAALGAGAFVVNYVVTYLFVIIDGADLGDEGWKSVGNILYNAQFVDSEISSSAGSETFNYLSDAGQGSDLTGTIPELLYTLAPLVVLVVAGYLLAQQAESRLDTGSAAATGATVVAGYLVLAILGTFLFEISSQGFGGTTTVAPELVPAIALVGLALPLILGAIGGALANEL